MILSVRSANTSEHSMICMESHRHVYATMNKSAGRKRESPAMARDALVRPCAQLQKLDAKAQVPDDGSVFLCLWCGRGPKAKGLNGHSSRDKAVCRSIAQLWFRGAVSQLSLVRRIIQHGKVLLSIHVIMRCRTGSFLTNKDCSA